ncbi:helix-turn-helix domain-containing protein [Actinoallomurus purpureus]|uniref:helix-turn-helix domain-containing protein n=1 Tax=Actinoallomurus purpureus TaxID=478114 RepID=UPI0020925197|nr:helix-turn-helix domain-containing protein [Actinoallomurus purpureus]MCO6005536.1 helix-turn-helix domain-containing protein [Actinoallomurus purpureus]
MMATAGRRSLRIGGRQAAFYSIFLVSDQAVCDYRTMDDRWSWLDVGQRVRESRVAAGLSQEDLARKIGLGRTMIAKIESGKRGMDALELAKFARTLGVPLGHFLTRPPEVLSHRAELSDDNASEAEAQSYRMDASLQEWLADIRQLITLGVLQVPERRGCPASVEDHGSARRVALWVRAETGWNLDPIDSLMTVCESMGQLVAVVEIPGDGASLIDGEVGAAVVSRIGDPGRRRTTAAHELGHFVVGDEYSNDLGVHTSRVDREKIINSFAAELLLPLSVVRAQAVSGVCSRKELIKLAASYRTSWTLAVSQAVTAGVAERSLSRNTPTRAEFLEAVGWAPQPDLESVRVPPVFAQAVLEAWRQSMITSTRAVEMMRGELEISDLPGRDESDVEP